MPIDIQPAEDRIYLAQWTGVVKFQEIIGAIKQSDQYAEERGEERYIVVMDAKDLRSVPFDVTSINQAIRTNSRAQGYLIVNPPPIGQALATLVGILAPFPIETFKDTDAALARARQIRDGQPPASQADADQFGKSSPKK